MKAKAREKKPMLSVEVPEQPKKLAVTVRGSTAQLVEEYREFLAARTGHPVTLDAVVEALVRTLDRDTLFSKWRKDCQKPSLSEK